MILGKGNRGADVTNVQTDLIKLGFGRYLGKYGADSVFGDATEKAVKRFQSWAEIQIDGLVGSETQHAIGQAKDKAGYNGTFNFNIKEFYSQGKDAPPSGMDNELLLKLERLRYLLGNRPMYINSGYRTPSHNKRVGGVRNSQHVYARAADIQVANTSASRVYSVADEVFHNGGVGKYNTFTHVDTRGYTARW